MGKEVRTETYREHRWFEYGRWFDGYGGDFGDHRCDDTVHCQWRKVTTTVVTETGSWSDEPNVIEEP